MKLIAGLGNPGRKYESTRHNAGCWWIDALAHSLNAGWRHEPKFHGELARVRGGGEDIWLLKPSTYMNESGRAVGAVADFYKIAPEEILVAHDELDLAPGVIKLKFGGSASGNGIRSVMTRLGSGQFWRLRIGIGHPRDLAQNSQEVVDFVLHAPRREEQAAIDDAMQRGMDVWPLIAAHDMQAAMHRLHTAPPTEPR
jgi:PTH1 family peptidyl-tRNA hydrolase